MTEAKHWYAVYTKPRWEKKVFRMLEERGIESYCPLNKVARQWSDRVKVIEEPLFKSYVFVRINDDSLTTVRFVEGVLNYVYWDGKPARIRYEEINLIRKFMSDYGNVKAVPLDVKPKDKVIVNAGVLLGQTGKVIKVLHSTAEVELESLGYKLIAKIDKRNLEVIGESK
jgi:transcription antitermination factor NusG